MPILAFTHKNCIGDAALPFVVKPAVVGGTVLNALEISDVHKYRSGAAAVEVEGVAATEPAQYLL